MLHAGEKILNQRFALYAIRVGPAWASRKQGVSVESGSLSLLKDPSWWC